MTECFDITCAIGESVPISADAANAIMKSPMNINVPVPEVSGAARDFRCLAGPLAAVYGCSSQTQAAVALGTTVATVFGPQIISGAHRFATSVKLALASAPAAHPGSKTVVSAAEPTKGQSLASAAQPDSKSAACAAEPGESPSAASAPATQPGSTSAASATEPTEGDKHDDPSHVLPVLFEAFGPMVLSNLPQKTDGTVQRLKDRKAAAVAKRAAERAAAEEAAAAAAKKRAVEASARKRAAEQAKAAQKRRAEANAASMASLYSLAGSF